MLNKKENEQIILTDSDGATSPDTENELHEDSTAVSDNSDLSEEGKIKFG
jgi:hypothetical protein